MTLTEEQRGALARAIDYINETDLPVGELDGFDREVLRAMIDSSDPITDVTELVELLAAGEHEQWAAWAQAILDSEPGLSDGRKAAWPGLIATPYENLSEEMKDEDRRVVHLRSQVVLDYIQQQSAEIERLRASLVEHEEHENQTHAILGAILGTDDTLENVAKRAAASIKELEGMLSIRTEELDIAHSVARSEKEMHEKELAAFARRIKELEADLAQSEISIQARLDVIDQQAARIAELEKWLKKERSARLLENSPGVRIAYLKENEIDFDKFFDGKALEQLQAEGKIGSSDHSSDVTKKVWQITEERKAAIWHAVAVLKENDPDDEHLWDEEIAVRRAMLTEAE